LDAVHPDDKERVLKAIAVQRKTGAGSNEEYRIIQPNGNVRWVWGRAFPIQDESGQVYRITALVVDITDRKHAEAEIKQKTEQLQALRQIGMEITSELDQDSVLHSITERALQLCGGITSSLYLYRRELDIVERLVFTGPSLFPGRRTRRRGEGLTGKVWETNAPVLVNDYRSWQERSTEYDAFPSRAVLGVPIRYGNEFLGVLNVIADPPKTYSSSDVETLSMFADQAAISVKNAHFYAAVQQLSVTDELTGFFNRRGLFRFGEREVGRALRFHHPLTAIMLDIDHFKQVNDTYGHPIGDDVLRGLAEVCRAQVRDVDIVARYGGEEFVLLLPEADLPNGVAVAERLRQTIENIKIPLESVASKENKTVQVTISLGVVALASNTLNLTTLIERLDQALYKAKQAGRNRVAVGE
jgi:diguanylate cyclase (GGDEF)-like protein